MSNNDEVTVKTEVMPVEVMTSEAWSRMLETMNESHFNPDGSIQPTEGRTRVRTARRAGAEAGVSLNKRRAWYSDNFWPDKYDVDLWKDGATDHIFLRIIDHDDGQHYSLRVLQDGSINLETAEEGTVWKLVNEGVNLHTVLLSILSRGLV